MVVGDGPARAEVEAALAPVAAGVCYAGATDETSLAGLLAAADLCAWPAVDEAYGMALLEAQAAGTPVVAGRVGGVPAIVADGETGLLVPPDDPAAFAAAVDTLLADPARRQAMGRAAAAKVGRDHDIDTAAQRLDALLRELAP
jgi:glycosyltransferase involved in cell wall biosynthesis